MNLDINSKSLGSVTKGACFVMARATPDYGVIVAAANRKGLLVVRFGNNFEEVRDQLVAENLDHALFPVANGAPEDVKNWLALAIKYAALGGERPDIPVFMTGSLFQIQVWKALMEIPEGENRTYAEIASTIGQPGAARAVGNACGQNGLAVVVPCHRVIKSDGQPGGYRWGMERKRMLLQRENGLAHIAMLPAIKQFVVGS